MVVPYHLSLCGSRGQAVMAALHLFHILHQVVCDYHQVHTSGKFLCLLSVGCILLKEIE